MKIKRKKTLLLSALFMFFTNFAFPQVTETVTLPGSETWDPLGWLQMIDEVGQMYDLITYNITQIENQYEQIANAVEAARGINWDDLEISGFDVRKDIKDAGKKINKLVTQARKIQETLEKPSINCGSQSYSIKDLVGGNGYDRNIFAAMDTMKTYMTDKMKSAIDDMNNGLSDKQKRAITQKYGLSSRNYLFIQQSYAQIQKGTGEAIAKASADAVDLVRAAKVTETNNILKAAYSSLDKDGNITEGASREAILLMSEQVVDNLMSLEEAINEINRLNALKLCEEQAKEEAKAAHEAEVRAARNSLNAMTGNMFKKSPGKDTNSWVDIPVIETIDYFSKMLVKVLKYVKCMATLFGVLGLLWTAFRLINSRITVKDMFWDTLYKWLLFIVLINCYVPLCSGVLYFSNYFGSNLGIGKDAIVENLVKIKTQTEAVTNSYTEFIDGKIAELKQKYPKNNFMSYSDFVEKSGEDSVGTAAAFMQLTLDGLERGYDNTMNLSGLSGSSKKNAKLVHKLEASTQDIQDLWNDADAYFEELDSQNLYSTKLLESLNHILVEKTTEGSSSDNLIESYFDVDLYLKDNQGNDTIYLAPSSLLRLGTFIAQLFWEQSKFDHVTNDYEEDEKPNFIERSVDNIGNTLLTIICCIAVVLSICFVLLQYIMCIIEFVIICSLGAFFIPMVLFDGTKELPKKLIPTITGFFIKMLVMNICTFFVFYLYLHFTSDVLCDSMGMNWVTVATVLFNVLLGFALTSNAPKVSQTLLTGQPQLSMGEAVAAFATAAGAIKYGSKGVSMAKKGTASAVRGTANGVTNVAGSGVKAAAAASVEMEKWSGGGKLIGGLKGAMGSFGRDIGEGIKSKGEDFLHGGKGGSGGGAGSAGGGKLHGQSGTYTKDNKDLGIKAGDSISSTSNPKFQSATIYDKELESNRNMSYKEFFHEKWNQGLNSAAQIESKAAESQQTKNLKDAGIGNNLDNRKNENTV